ncbi:uncharacterized protein LOC109950491 [Prunus persica]|uniref:uncharacterized protein LOC109950491 n=1 Tax=Prunus persica TaxID=3760 RepID=UPI0009AB8A5C|nr:uncharacterized protein LOC109950491 [Prunus persica]
MSTLYPLKNSFSESESNLSQFLSSVEPRKNWRASDQVIRRLSKPQLEEALTTTSIVETTPPIAYIGNKQKEKKRSSDISNRRLLLLPGPSFLVPQIAFAVMVFKESDEMVQLKQQQVETGFELFHKFTKIVDPEGNWDNITVGGVMNFIGHGRRN